MKKRLRSGKSVISLLLAIVLVLSGIPLFPGDHTGIAKASTTLRVNPNRFSPVYGGQSDLTFVYDNPDIDHGQTTHSTNIQTCERSAGVIPDFMQMIHSGTYPTTPQGQPTINNNYTWDGFADGAALQEGAYQVCVTPTDAPTQDDHGNPVYYGISSDVSIINPAPPAPKYVTVNPNADLTKTTHVISGIAEINNPAVSDEKNTVTVEIEYFNHDNPGVSVGRAVYMADVLPKDSNEGWWGEHPNWLDGKSVDASYFNDFPENSKTTPQNMTGKWSVEVQLDPYLIAVIKTHVTRGYDDKKSTDSQEIHVLRYVAKNYGVLWEAIAAYYYKVYDYPSINKTVGEIAQDNGLTVPICKETQPCPGWVMKHWNLLIFNPLRSYDVIDNEKDFLEEAKSHNLIFPGPIKGDPINLATGDFAFSHTNLSLQAIMPLNFTVTYHSRDLYDGAMGVGWHHTFEWRLEKRDQDILYVVTPEGAKYPYIPLSGGKYETPPGTFNTLVKLADGTYEMTNSQKWKYQFREDGALLSITDANGNITKLKYEGTLLMEASTEGASLSFTYGNGGKIARVTDQTGRYAEYEYNDLRHELNVIHLPDGAKIQFGYDNEHRMTSMSNPNGDATLTNEYDEAGRVHVQRDFYGTTRTMVYTPEQKKTTVTEDDGRTTVYHFDARYRQTAVEYLDGTSEHFDYDENDNITSKTDRNGNTMTYQYDLMGNMHQVIDPYGNVTTIEYNSFNKPLQITDALGNTTLLSYDDKGNIKGIQDALHHSYTIIHDSRGLPTSITNPKGETVAIKNDAFGFAEFVTDPLGYRQHLQRDGLHRVTSITDALNQISGMEYDERDRVKSRTDALQQKEEFQYDSDSNLIYHRDPAGGETHMGYSGSFDQMTSMDRSASRDSNSKQVNKVKYDVFGNVIEAVDPKGAITEYHYNNVNRLDTMTVHEKDNHDNDVPLVTHFEYDGNGNLTKKTDPKGNVTVTQYDKRNLPISSTDASGAATTYEYDKLGHQTKVTNALGNSTIYEYDPLGQIVKVTDATLHSTTFVYDEAGLLISTVKANGAVWKMQYDARGMLVGTIDPLGNMTSMQRDGLGRVISSKDQAGTVTKYNYDALSRVTSIMDAMNQKTDMSYDPVGRIQAITDAKKQTTNYTYDLLGRLTSVTNALGVSTGYAYDAVGNITSKVDAMQRVTSYQYNMRDELIAQIDPLQQMTQLAYDDNGNMSSIVHPDGKKTSYQYDNVNRLTDMLYSDATSVHYAYDSLGRRTMMQDEQGTTTYAFDVLNRLTQVTNGAHQTIRYEWTPTNQRSKVIYPDGSVVNYGYDLIDRMTSVTDGGGLTTNYAYDARGLLLSKTLPTQGISTYQYDALGQVMNIRHANQFGKVVEQLSYAYDPVGNRIRMERSTDGNDEDDTDSGDHPESVITEYAYDALNQLTQVQQTNPGSTTAPITTNYNYDAVGNRLSKQLAWSGISNLEQYTYDGANKLTHWQNGSDYKDFTYDLRGNMLKVMGVISDDEGDETADGMSSVSNLVYGGNSVPENVYGQPLAVTSSTTSTPRVLEQYGWNAANYLVQHVSDKGDISRYAYDGDGNRTKMTVDVDHGPTDHSNGNGQGNGNGNGNESSNGNANCHEVPPGFIPPGLAKKCGQVEEPYPDMHPGGPREGWEKEFKKKHWEFNYTNDVSLANPEPLQVTDKDQLSGANDYYSWKESYTYGAGGERISMTYLPANDANNGWDPHDGTAGAEPGVAPRTLWYLNDALGSAVGLIEKDGRVSSRYHYDEFGTPTDAKKFDVNWPGPDNLFGYTGLEYDYYSGLTNARARSYKPEIGRFISEDTYKGTLGNPQSLNLYTYVSNNPLIYTDPSGNLQKGDENLPGYNDILIITTSYLDAVRDGMSVRDAAIKYGGMADRIRNKSGYWTTTDSTGEQITAPAPDWYMQETLNGSAKKPSLGEEAAIMGGATVVGAGCIISGLVNCASVAGTAVDGLSGQVAVVKNSTTPWDIKTNASNKIDYDINGAKVSAYQDPNTGLYWARDTEGHGGSAFKVFEKRGNELIWKADADSYGNYLEGKYKGSTGMRIKIK